MLADYCQVLPNHNVSMKGEAWAWEKESKKIKSKERPAGHVVACNRARRRRARWDVYATGRGPCPARTWYTGFAVHLEHALTGEMRQISTHLHIVRHFRCTKGLFLPLLLLSREFCQTLEGKEDKRKTGSCRDWLWMDPRKLWETWWWLILKYFMLSSSDYKSVQNYLTLNPKEINYNLWYFLK